jgi:hypothetical protein
MSLKDFGLLGYKIGGWGALIALVVSVGTFVWTVADKFIIGPRPELVPPETVNFWCSAWHHDDSKNIDVCDPEQDLLILVRPLTFLNRASSPHSYVLRTTSVEVGFLNATRVATKTIALGWEYFTEISVSDLKRTPAIPITVAGETSISKEIEFYPRLIIDKDNTVSRANFLPFSEFQTLIAKGEIKTIHLKFVATTLDAKKEFSAGCEVPVDAQFIQNASSHALFSRECKSG